MKPVSLNSESFRIRFMQSGRTPMARLKNLGRTLSEWNRARYGKVETLEEADLTLEDIKCLRDLINTEISRLSLNNSEIVADQILFLAVGAIKLQLQKKSEEPWSLVTTSIATFLKPDRRHNMLLLTMLVMMPLMILAISMVTYKPQIPQQDSQLFQSDPERGAMITETGVNSVSNLVEIYKKMKEGVCQLPQAAMLQSQEREVFLSFVNEGKVDISTAESLKKSLESVTCLYPQKLMGSRLQ